MSKSQHQIKLLHWSIGDQLKVPVETTITLIIIIVVYGGFQVELFNL